MANEFFTVIKGMVLQGEKSKQILAYIEEQRSADPSWIEQKFFWEEQYRSLTEFLILLHQESPLAASGLDEENEKEEGKEEDVIVDLIPLIIEVMKMQRDVLLFNPLHQALAQGKVKLAQKLIQTFQDALRQNPNVYDREGATLLARAIYLKNKGLLEVLIGFEHLSICLSSGLKIDGRIRVEMLPIEQAIIDACPDFINLYATHSSFPQVLSSRLGANEETALTLAVSERRWEELEALLPHCRGEKKALLEAQNKEGKTAFGLAFSWYRGAFQPTEKKVAMNMMIALLNHGAVLPNSERVLSTLTENKAEFLSQLGKYWRYKGDTDMVEEFYNRCHDARSELHQVIYGQDSLTDSLRHLVGQPRKAAVEFEKIYLDFLDFKNKEISEEGAAQAFSDLGDHEKFARFVNVYDEEYKNTFFTNPWSSMRWKIERGELSTWEKVEAYARECPKSRTSTLVYYLLKDSVKKETKPEPPK